VLRRGSRGVIALIIAGLSRWVRPNLGNQASGCKLNLGLHGSARGSPPEYHGWKSVDCSTPAYQGSATNSPNATDGNPWIVQIQPAVSPPLPLHDERSQPIFGSEVPHLIAPQVNIPASSNQSYPAMRYIKRLISTSSASGFHALSLDAYSGIVGENVKNRLGRGSEHLKI
jgi:hypothetical protein